jgi:hypothetical protein
MAEEVAALLWPEGLNNAADLSQQAWNCVLGSFAQVGLQFAESLVEAPRGGPTARDPGLLHRCDDSAQPERSFRLSGPRLVGIKLRAKMRTLSSAIFSAGSEK